MRRISHNGRIITTVASSWTELIQFLWELGAGLTAFFFVEPVWSDIRHGVLRALGQHVFLLAAFEAAYGALCFCLYMMCVKLKLKAESASSQVADPAP